jgi:hypothetical protein
MAFVHARHRGWRTDALDFVTVRNLEGAIDAFAGGAADVFFWEKFMTKPLVDAGKFRRVGEFVAPWPAFVVCATDAAIATRGHALAALLRAVLTTAAELAASSDAAQLIARRYALDPADTTEWLRATRWTAEPAIEPQSIEACAAALRALGLIAGGFETRAAVAPLPAS